jgi:hypothetical protein
VNYGDVSFVAPADWLNTDETQWSPGSCGFAVEPEYDQAVVFVAGTSMSAPQSCPAPQEPNVSEVQPVDGVLVDPGPYGPLQDDSNFGTCLHINGLTACPTTASLDGALVLAVHLPGGTHPVAVEIGLAGNGMVARTILNSMRASVGNSTVPPTTSTTAKPTQTQRAARCAGAQLAATATRESGAYSHMGIVVAFRNAETQCSLDGYPTAWFVDAAGRRLGDVSVHQGGGTASPVLLPHFGFASTTVWTADPGMVAGGSVGASCQPEVATGIDMTLPGQSAVVFAPIVVSVCTTNQAVPWTTPIVSGTQERSS